MRARKREGRDGSRKKVNGGLSVLLLEFVISYFEVFHLGFFLYFFDAAERDFLQDESLQ